MFKVFNLGIVLGIAAAVALAHFVPVVDLYRETSMIVVQANRANTEAFHISLPRDRIMAGVSGLRNTIPPGLAWPEFEFLTDMQTEMFKVRNDNGIVVGVASRLSGTSEDMGSFVEWAIHLPARGTMFVTMAPRLSAEGYREGSLRAGTREFLTLHGPIVERFVRETGESDSDISGRIEIIASLVGPAEAAE